jgi:hypothetical protein
MRFDRDKIFASARQSIYERQYGHEYGIRQYMLYVYQHMALALIITAITSAVFMSSATFINLILNSPLKLILAIVPIVVVLCYFIRILLIYSYVVYSYLVSVAINVYKNNQMIIW